MGDFREGELRDRIAELEVLLDQRCAELAESDAKYLKAERERDRVGEAYDRMKKCANRRERERDEAIATQNTAMRQRNDAVRERDELKGWKTKAAARLVSMICALEAIQEDAGSTNIAPIARGCGILQDAIDAALGGESDGHG